jgi:hypothetical protein
MTSTLCLRETHMAHAPRSRPAISLQYKLAGYLKGDLLRSLLLVLLAVAVHIPALSGQLIWDDGDSAIDL